MKPRPRFEVPPLLPNVVRTPKRTARNQSRIQPATSWLTRITEDILRDTTKLMALLQTSTEPSLTAHSHAIQRRVIELAVHMTRSKGVRNPAAAFVAKINKRDWSTITEADEIEAKRRHSAWLGMEGPRRGRRAPMLIGDVLRELIQQRNWRAEP